ncbi:hypothetical protein SAMN05443248_1954 [Bradyrhizobium erythrophlei]|uniref:Transposase n=1 Tax=Bradyrhizobium erythrophlei TaxID=1437360 RepID=A0A1M5KT47_9BRAD|nr:hypothetical protein SAMN05443248_1954 [Bradyrhizobium erythrophlei]
MKTNFSFFGSGRIVRNRGTSVFSGMQTSTFVRCDSYLREYDVLREWLKAFAADPQQAFPGHGQLRPEQHKIAQLKRELARLKAERDILKKAAVYFAKEST